MPVNPLSQKPNIQTGLIVTVMLGVMLALMITSGWHKNLSFDEPHNLRYGYDVLTQGPLAETDGQRMPVFVLNALACKSYGCVYEKTENHPWRLLGIRLPGMLFTLALGFLIWHWCRSLYGDKAALGALFLFAFNPNFIAHGKEVTSDVMTTFFVVLTVFLFWKWRDSRKERFFYLTALAAGVAVVAKFSSILLFGILPLILIVQKIWGRDFRVTFTELLQATGRSIIFLFLIWLVINSAYLFQGSFESSRSYPWQSRFYQKIAAKEDFLIPLPRIFVRGLDYSHLITEHPEYGRGNNYILGHRHRKGRDYAFPVMLGLKTPLAFFALLIASMVMWKMPKPPKSDQASGIYLWIPFGVWFIFFSSICDIQVGIRYILPGYIFLLIFAAKAFENTATKLRAAFLCAACLWYALSTLSYHPHTMSYFNELIGDRINAYKYLADSNLDWEDKSYYVKKWESDHPKIKYLTHPEAMWDPQPGFFLMPANYYVGVFDEDKYRWMREFKPLAHITYSHYLFYIGTEELAEALKKYPIPGKPTAH